MGAATGKLRLEVGKSGLEAAKAAGNARVPLKNRSPDPRTGIVARAGRRFSTNC